MKHLHTVSPVESLMVSRQFYTEAGAARYRKGAVAFKHTALTQQSLDTRDVLLANIGRSRYMGWNVIFLLHLLAEECPHVRGIHVLGASESCHCCIKCRSDSSWTNNKWADPEIHWYALKQAMLPSHELRYVRIGTRCSREETLIGNASRSER